MAGSTFNVMAVLTGRVQGLDQFDAFNRRLNTVGRTADSVNRQMSSLTTAIRGLAAGFGGAQLADFAGEIARVTIQLDAFRAQLRQGFGDYATQQLVNTRDALRDIGIAQEEALGSAVRFTTSMRLAGISARDANQSFRDAAKWVAANRLNGEEANRVFNAMSQIFSKGRLTAEELRNQIGDSGVAGAFQLVARALGMTSLELSNAMQNGAVSSEDFRRALGRIAQDIDPSTLESAARSLANLKNAWFDLKAALLSSDTVKAILDGVAAGIRFITDNADGIRQTAVNALQVASAFMLWRSASTFVWALAFSLRTYGAAATLAINVINPLRAAFASLTATMMVNPFVAIGTAIAALVAILWTFKDVIHPISGEAATLGDYLSVMADDVISLTSTLWELVGSAFRAVMDGIRTIAALLPTIDWPTVAHYAKVFGNTVIGVFVALVTSSYQVGRLIFAAWQHTFNAVKDLGYNFGLDIAAMFRGDFSFSHLRAGLGNELQGMASDVQRIGGDIRGTLTHDYLGDAGTYVQGVRRRANDRHRTAGTPAMPGGTTTPPPANDNGSDSSNSRSRASQRDQFAELMAQLQFERDQLQRTAREQFIMTQIRQAEINPLSEQARLLRERAGLLYDEREKQEESNRALERAATLQEMLTDAMRDSARVRDQIDQLQGRSQSEIDRRNYRESLDAQINQNMAQYARQKDAAGRSLYTPQQLAAMRAELEATGQKAMDIYDQSQRDLAAAQGNWMNGLNAGMRAYADSIQNVAGAMSETVQKGFKGMEDALVTFVTTGKLSFTDLVNSIISDMVRIAVQQAIIKPLMTAFGFKFADGGVFEGGSLTKFAVGGVVTSPTVFPMARGGMGLMGEAGPEAIMPLRRLGNGRLGVEAAGGGTQNIAVTVNVEGGQSKVQGDAGKASQLGQIVAQAVRSELVVQKRPGGLLAAA